VIIDTESKQCGYRWCFWIVTECGSTSDTSGYQRSDVAMMLSFRMLSLETARCGRLLAPVLCVLRSRTHSGSVVWVAACISVTWKAIDKGTKGEQRRKPAYVAPPISFGENGPLLWPRGFVLLVCSLAVLINV
jgi:hypothetical protein